MAAQETPADLLQDPKLSKWAKGVKYRRQDPETVATQMRQSMVPEDQIARFLAAYGKTPLAPVVKSTEPAEKDNGSRIGPGQGKGDRGKGGKGPAGRGKGGPATDPVLIFKSAPQAPHDTLPILLGQAELARLRAENEANRQAKLTAAKDLILPVALSLTVTFAFRSQARSNPNPYWNTIPGPPCCHKRPRRDARGATRWP